MGHQAPDGYTADTIVIAPRDGQLCVLLIRRATDHDTHPGKWALPGGHVDLGETSRAAAYRELAEETGLDLRARGVDLLLVGVYDEPGRDPRGWYASVAYVAQSSEAPPVVGGDDADRAAWVPIDEALAADLAFDHGRILRGALHRLGLPAPA